ncbi:MULTISPECIES: HD-GYP domain-containing protein [Deinococcus]|uniref:HD-GYP domain-containing protein n=1 Tax=Deinococcus rufus TaxID=2136097 RepID=A0ABV7ZBI5_9DEIO|nr:HD-GYP domain-containing protein [Deinococcus sp. AB2017081]WQE94892.1 HD-GYP domain-containing protein [Deinococcus sp. AB2017081]
MRADLTLAPVRDVAVQRARWPLVAGIGGPALLLALLLAVPVLNARLELLSVHMLLVLAAAAFTAVVTVWMGLVGVRQRNAEVILLSLAFGSLGLVYGVHGLATPEVGVMGHVGHSGMDMTGAAATSALDAEYGTATLPAAAQLGAMLAAAWLLLSSVPATNSVVRAVLTLRGWLPGVWVAALIGLGTMIFMPEVAGVLAPTGVPERLVILAVTVGLGLWAAARYWRSWRYTRFPLQLSVVYAGGWLALAQLVIVLNLAWTLSWWVYHVLLVGVSAALLTGLIAQYRDRDVPVGAAVRGLWNNDPDEVLAAGISAPVRALIAQVEAHDPYTAGHAHRVTLYALDLARALGCSPEALRVITQGGILHDLGKLDVPTGVLNHPGRLSGADWTLVRQHPSAGVERAQHLGLLPEELGVVRWHHERWDGAGYPDGLYGDQIPLLARILAVADVYDALTSERAYRQPWPATRANAYLQDEAGRAFDPRVVAAWLALHRTEPGLGTTPVLGESRPPLGASAAFGH